MIDDALAAFLHDGLAVHLGTRNARLEPSGARAMGVLVGNGGESLTVFIPEVAAPAVLSDMTDNGQAAVCFARPEDDRACQVKGVFVAAAAATPGDRDEALRQWRGFLRRLSVIGIPGESTRTWIDQPLVAVTLRVTAIFTQTPGADAGKRLL